MSSNWITEDTPTRPPMITSELSDSQVRSTTFESSTVPDYSLCGSFSLAGCSLCFDDTVYNSPTVLLSSRCDSLKSYHVGSLPIFISSIHHLGKTVLWHVTKYLFFDTSSTLVPQPERFSICFPSWTHPNLIFLEPLTAFVKRSQLVCFFCTLCRPGSLFRLLIMTCCCCPEFLSKFF